jgi:hypothetical protein
MRPVKMLLGIVALTFATLIPTTSASAATPGAVAIGGIQYAAATECGGFDSSPFGTYVMTGNLVGCWYTDSADLRVATPSGGFVETGTEHFTGCLAATGQCGTLWFTFTFTGRFDPLTGAELHGRCHHPIVRGDGDFAHARGVVNFHDDVLNSTYPYSGNITT